MTIAILGFGFVGQAVASSFPKDQLFICDPDAEACQRAVDLGYSATPYPEDMALNYDAVFVCVPTPALDARHQQGPCDPQYLIRAVTQALTMTATVICKCTAPASVYERFDPHLVAFVPEFLRAATADQDYAAQQQVVIGADSRDLFDRVVKVFNQSSLVNKDKLHIRRNAAVMVKYTHNIALAAKLAIMNEMYQVAQAYGVSWSDVVAGLQWTNAGGSHTNVPGPDGKLGFGGGCFPKDLQAMLYEIRDLNQAGGRYLPWGVMQAVNNWNQQDYGFKYVLANPTMLGKMP